MFRYQLLIARLDHVGGLIAAWQRQVLDEKDGQNRVKKLGAGGR